MNSYLTDFPTMTKVWITAPSEKKLIPEITRLSGDAIFIRDLHIDELKIKSRNFH